MNINKEVRIGCAEKENDISLPFEERVGTLTFKRLEKDYEQNISKMS